MGSNTSKLVKNIFPHFNNNNDTNVTDICGSVRKLRSPCVVVSRKGSMYFDEDGDLAHEFYVEIPPPRKGCKATMKKVIHNLIPQGEVAHPFPRLHVDFPVILHHV